MTEQQRKEWLIDEINMLAGLDIKGLLSGEGAFKYQSYASELDNILRQEKNEAKDKKQEVTKKAKKIQKNKKRVEDWWAAHLPKDKWVWKGRKLRGLDVPDFESETAVLEVTQLKQPRWGDFDREFREAHSKPHKMTIVAIHRNGEDMMSDKVTMSIKDFLEWYA